MKLFYLSVIELNSGYGAEVFLNRSLLKLGHQTHTLDYRKHRERLPEKFLEAPEFDALLLQRGEYFALPLLEACNRPRFFYSSELFSRRDDQHHLFRSGLFHHVFVRTPDCKRAIVQRGWMEPERISILLSAFDEETHRPLPGVEKDIDVLFVGGITPRRRAVLDELKKHFSVHECQAFGPDMAAVFNRAKIALNIHAADQLDTETRVFEALGSGAFLISETLSPENPFRKGEHYAEVSSPEEMADRIRHYLDHEDERQTVAEQGHREAVRKHSYFARAVEIAERIRAHLSEASPAVPALDRGKIEALLPSAGRPPLSVQTNPASLSQEKAMNSTPRTRIGIVTTWFERGAAYVSKQIRRVLEPHHDVFVFARGGEMTAVGDPNWDDARITWAKKSPSPVPTSFDMAEFRAWIVGNRIQTVLFNEQHWWPPVLGCAQLGLKIGSYVDYYTEMTIPIFNCYDFLICNTQRHHSVFGWHPQAAYVPWGTDLELFRPRSWEPVETGKTTFFHSAGFNPHRKGTDFVLQAFAGVQGPARLAIHSQVSLRTHLPHLAGVIDAMERDGRLVIHEKTVTAPGLYHLGDVYVYPSRLEGIGLTVAEAMACGLPLVTSDNGPMNEFHDEASGALARITRLFARHDGYYWPQCLVDTNHLREILQEITDHPERLGERKQAARAFAERRLNWSENAKDLPRQIAEFGIRPLREREEAFRQAQAFEQRRMSGPR